MVMPYDDSESFFSLKFYAVKSKLFGITSSFVREARVTRAARPPGGSRRLRRAERRSQTHSAYNETLSAKVAFASGSSQ